MTEHQPDGVVIGFKEIYDTLLEVRSAVEFRAAQQDEHSRRLDDHERRIRQGEQRRWPLPVMSALGSIVAAIVAVFALIHQ